MRRLTLLAALLGSLHATVAMAQTAPAAAPSATSSVVPLVVDWSRMKPSHPRLFVDETQLKQIVARDDKVSKQLLSLVRSHAESALGEPDIVYPPAGSNTEYPGPGGKFSAMRQVQGRVLSLALGYRIWRDPRYLAKAKRDLLQLTEVPDWNPKHFLTLSEGALTAAVGYDWLYPDLSADERDILANAIKVKGLNPSLDAGPGTTNGLDVNRSWLDANYNWNPVVNGGLAVAALAIAEREPALANTIVNRSIHYIPYMAKAYEPDGAWPEAPNYWAYGTSFYVIATEALRSALGSDYGLSSHSGFRKTGDYNIQVVGPTGFEWNYSDYGLETHNEPSMMWLARETRQSDLIGDELVELDRLTGVSPQPSGRQTVRNRHTPLELLWWDPTLVAPSAKGRSTHWTAQGHAPLGISRTRWNDSNATFVAVKGGLPNYSHAHMDVGSFVLEADGVRWAVDLGSESYDMMRKVKLDLWNMTQDSGRWTTFRVGAEGHNILRFNNGPQLVDGVGELRAISGPGYVGHVVDLTASYAQDASRVSREIRLSPDGVVNIRDQWSLKARPADVSAQWLTYAEATRTPYGVRLSQAGKTLRIEVADPTSVRIEIEDVSSPRLPQDSPNPGLKRVTFHSTTPAGRSGELRLTIRPGSLQGGASAASQ